MEFFLAQGNCKHCHMWEHSSQWKYRHAFQTLLCGMICSQEKTDTLSLCRCRRLWVIRMTLFTSYYLSCSGIIPRRLSWSLREYGVSQCSLVGNQSTPIVLKMRGLTRAVRAESFIQSASHVCKVNGTIITDLSCMFSVACRQPDLSQSPKKRSMKSEWSSYFPSFFQSSEKQHECVTNKMFLHVFMRSL